MEYGKTKYHEHISGKYSADEMCSWIITVISKHWTYLIFKCFAVGHGYTLSFFGACVYTILFAGM
jgi:hypothetical protein